MSLFNRYRKIILILGCLAIFSVTVVGCSSTEDEVTNTISESKGTQKETESKEESTSEDGTATQENGEDMEKGEVVGLDDYGTATQENGEKNENMIYAYIGDEVLNILPEGNISSDAFIELLRKGDLTVDMQDYGSFEKVGALGNELPTEDKQITTEPGDVILYQGNSITIYYDTNSWNFTRLGKIQNISQDELKRILGDGDVSVTFSLSK